MSLRLYSYFRSSAAFRVRIALELKGLDYSIESVNLAQGAQREAAYRALNPQGFVPALALPDGTLLTQSPAIIEWLESEYPQPALLPAGATARAHIRSLCAIVACDIHPLNNLRILNYLEQQIGLDRAARDNWYHQWLREGFDAIEPRLPATGFAGGEAPGMAEAYLVPQVYNARRFHFDVSAYPRLSALVERCHALDAFARAHPDAQPDRPL